MMSASNFFARQAAAFNNDLRRSCSALLGIAQGVLADGAINIAELAFLDDWLSSNESVANAWPGNVIHARIRDVRRHGVITAAEHADLLAILQALVGGRFDELADNRHVSTLAFDMVQGLDFAGRLFCLTGDFVFGPRAACEAEIERRGGVIKSGVTRKLNYVIVGGLGSAEWKHGSFGTKIEKTMQLKQAGAPIKIVHEDVWAASLFS